MSKMKRPRTIVDKAILIGYTPEGECVYNTVISLEKYYDGEHPWDSSDQVQALRLHRLHGYLFGTDGELEQEFESVFDLESGIFSKGWAKHSDGTFIEHWPAHVSDGMLGNNGLNYQQPKYNRRPANAIVKQLCRFSGQGRSPCSVCVHKPNCRFNSDVNASHCRRLTLALANPHEQAETQAHASGSVIATQRCRKTVPSSFAWREN